MMVFNVKITKIDPIKKDDSNLINLHLRSDTIRKIFSSLFSQKSLKLGGSDGKSQKNDENQTVLNDRENKFP